MACNLVGLGAVYWLPPCCCGWLYLVEPTGNHTIFKAHIMACLLLPPPSFSQRIFTLFASGRFTV